MIMTSEQIRLNLIPGDELPVLHASQFDVNRALSFALYDGDDEFTDIDAYDFELHIRKVDGTVVTINTYEFDSNVITFLTTEQTTACSGKNIGEIVITDEIIGSVIGSCNFILEVEPDPFIGGINSESEIANINSQIASLIDEQLADYYTKDEIDERITTIIEEQVTPTVSSIVSELVPPAVQAELGNYYDKSEVDILLGNKANSDDVYTKTEVDTLTGKFITGTLTTGNTSLTLSDEDITTSSIIDIYTDVFGISPVNAVTTTGQIVLTFESQSVDVGVKVWIR